MLYFEGRVDLVVQGYPELESDLISIKTKIAALLDPTPYSKRLILPKSGFSILKCVKIMKYYQININFLNKSFLI